MTAMVKYGSGVLGMAVMLTSGLGILDTVTSGFGCYGLVPFSNLIFASSTGWLDPPINDVESKQMFFYL